MLEKNTCERAFDVLAARPDMIYRGARGLLETRRKLAAAGTVSDGTRVVSIAPCAQFRWLIVATGAGTIAEIDQRAYWERPGEMAEAVLAALAKAEV